MPGKRERGAEVSQKAEKEDDVERQSYHRIDPGEPVDDQDCKHDQNRADHPGLEPLLDRVLAQRRTYRALLQIGDRSRKCTRAQHHGKVLRLFGGEATLDQPSIGDTRTNIRCCHDIAVEYDCQAPAHVGSGHVGESLTALVIQREVHHRLVELAQPGSSVLEVATRDHGAHLHRAEGLAHDPSVLS